MVRAQDPFRGGTPGQREESWVGEGFTEDLAVLGLCQVEEVWGARVKSAGGAGHREECVPSTKTRNITMC